MDKLMLNRALFAFILFGYFAFPLTAVGGYKDGVWIEVIDYGIYEQARYFTYIPDAESTTGHRIESDHFDAVRLKAQTLEVPLEKGVIFGFRVKIHGATEQGPVPRTVRQPFPPIVHPDGSASTHYTAKGNVDPLSF